MLCQYKNPSGSMIGPERGVSDGIYIPLLYHETMFSFFFSCSADLSQLVTA
jgi:hypothetical protein